MSQDKNSRQIQIAGRNIRCDSEEDRALLSAAKAITEDPSTAGGIKLDRLYVLRDACQRYSVGKAQRLVKMAIDRLERQQPH
ncbi:MAG: hypothetical protein JNL18_02905 [Planctomycetaceae bacterium]|uniref:Uncharacterized protein n=1 Tax=Lacipirellula limnantheis TaxID=2528024 RepID=A0A517TYT6_9BACT|nr:hypothetical protein [Lacipirellula limnantheis]MBL9161673.1 hypothetical protein [Planctomycetaceae bacterium]QDT73536.1 hypothetical protein I41_27250 [Lacipirellula limnantheis]